MNRKNLAKLLVLGFCGGLVSGALGLGGGSIFNPILLSMGVAPTVSSATGMYMIMLSTIASSTLYILNKMLNVRFALWIGLWSVVGTMAGLTIIKKIIKKFNR